MINTDKNQFEHVQEVMQEVRTRYRWITFLISLMLTFLVLSLFGGCASSTEIERETTVREQIIAVKPQNIDINVPVLQWTDTLVKAVAIDVFRNDTIAWVVANKNKGTARVKVRTDTIYVQKRDTLTKVVVQEKPQEPQPVQQEEGFFTRVANAIYKGVIAVILLCVAVVAVFAYRKIKEGKIV